MIKSKSKILFFLLIIIIDLIQINSINLESIDNQWIQFTDDETEVIIKLNFDSTIENNNLKIKINNKQLDSLEIIGKEITLTLKKDDFANVKGIYEISLINNTVETDLNKSLIFSNQDKLTSGSISINHNILINPSNQDITFTSTTNYTNISFEIKCLIQPNVFSEKKGTFNETSGSIKFNSNEEIQTCDFYFDDGSSNLNLNLPFYTFNSIDNYISIKPSFEGEECFYYNIFNDNSFIIEKKTTIIGDEFFKTIIEQYSLTLNYGTNSFNYVLDIDNDKFSLSENTQLLPNTDYNLTLKDKSDGIVLYNKENIKLSDIKLPGNKFGYYYIFEENKNVVIKLNSLYCDLSNQEFVISDNSNTKECTNSYDDDENVITLTCEFDDNLINNTFDILMKGSKIDNENQIKISRYLNDTNLKFKVNEIQNLKLGENTIEISCDSDSNFDYEQIKKVIVNKTLNGTTQQNEYVKNDNLTIESSKISFKIVIDNIYETYKIISLNNDDTKKSENIENSEIKFDTFTISKQYLILINNQESNLETKLQCESSEKANSINDSIDFSNTGFEATISGNDIILNGKFNAKKVISFSYLNQIFQIYIINIKYTNCYEESNEREFEIELDLPNELTLNYTLKTKNKDDKIENCNENKCNLKIENSPYTLTIKIKEEETEIGNVNLYKKDEVNKFDDINLIKDDNQNLQFSFKDDFEYSDSNHFFYLIKDENTISPSSCNQKENKITCIFNLVDSNEGEYELYLNNEEKCKINTKI